MLTRVFITELFIELKTASVHVSAVRKMVNEMTVLPRKVEKPPAVQPGGPS